MNNTDDIKKWKYCLGYLFHSISSKNDTHLKHCDDKWFPEKEGRDPGEVQKQKQINPPLTKDVCELLVPLFKRLVDPELLKVYPYPYMKKGAKNNICRKKTFETGLPLAVKEFNKGTAVISDTLEEMGLVPGTVTGHIAEKHILIIKSLEFSQLHINPLQV